MIEWTIPDMTCNHCAANVTREVQALDPAARVEIDLASRQVRVQTDTEPGPIAQALARAGYAPSPAAPG